MLSTRWCSGVSMLAGWRRTFVAVLRLWGWLDADGATTERSSTASTDAPSMPSDGVAEAGQTICRPRDGRLVSAVLVLAGLSRATIPVPYWVVARAIEQDSGQTLLALLELEAAGIVASQRFAGGGVLYAIVREERWRETWSS